MSQINLDYEKFKTEYYEVCTGILLGMKISSDCSIDHTKISSKVEESIINAYKRLYHVVYKSIAAMLMDWDVADVSLSNIELTDTYMSQMYGIDGKTPVPYVTSLYDGLLTGRNNNSALLNELGIEIMGQECVAVDEGVINSVDIENLISTISSNFQLFEDGAEQYKSKLADLVIDETVESVAARSIKSNMTSIHTEIITLLQKIMDEFIQDIYDYINGYRLRLPDEGCFILKREELSETQEDIDELLDNYTSKVVDLNSVIGQASSLSTTDISGTSVTLSGLQKVDNNSKETVEDSLSDLSKTIGRIVEIIDDMESSFIQLIEGDLSDDIQCMNEIAETMYYSEHGTSQGIVLHTSNLKDVMGPDFIIDIEVENKIYEGEQSSFAYYYLQIFDANGNVIEAKLEEFIEYCEAIGLDSKVIDENFLKGLEIYIEHLKEQGYNEDFIFNVLIPSIMTEDLAEVLNNLGSFQSSGGMPQDIWYGYISGFIEELDENVEERGMSFIKEKLGLEQDGKDYIERFWDVFNQNVNNYPEYYKTLSAFYSLNPSDFSPEEYRQRQIDAMMALARLCRGYEESEGNVTIFGDWYGYHTYWCGQFVSFLLSAVGLAGDTTDSIGALSIDGDTNLTVSDIKNWGATAYEFGSNGSDTSRLGSNRYYTRAELKDENCDFVPQVGDIVITAGDGDGHVCIINEVKDDGTFTTIDGNSGNKVSIVSSRTVDSIVGIVDIHSI